MLVKSNLKNQKVTEFLENYCDGIKKEIKKFYDDLGENPLQYKEQTFKSLVFPVLQKKSKRTIMEHYYLKVNQEKNKKNFLDFYSLDKNEKCSYLIEFKHGWDNPANKKVTKTTLDHWENVKEQIEKLDKDSVENYIDTDKEIYGLAIMNVVTYSNNPKGIEHIYKTKPNGYSEDKIGKQLKGADWIWSWEIEKSLNKKFKESNENDATYTHLTVLAKIKKIR